MYNMAGKGDFMQSLKQLYKIGHGPSSSHTMGPDKACHYILKKYPQVKKVEVILFGSLALTGKGHLTDKIIYETQKDGVSLFEHSYYLTSKGDRAIISMIKEKEPFTGLTPADHRISKEIDINRIVAII